MKKDRRERAGGARHGGRKPAAANAGALLAGLWAACWLVLGLAGDGLAQNSLAGSLSGFSSTSDQPIDIASDTLEVRDNEKVAIFSGNVNVVQGETVMKTKTLKVSYEGGAGGSDDRKISRLEALGRVIVQTKDQTVTGSRALFDMRSKLITVEGDVVLSQGKNVLRGSRLVIDLNAGASRLESPNGGSGGRVTGSFVPSAQPKKNDDDKEMRR
ncbi:MAG: LPS ABC transporter substrate-binding protein LptA [Rhodobiaceae bacterium]|nr:LPS ABC transporter substrate-binding protein LptA [Rhodobiaceae bacterium]